MKSPEPNLTMYTKQALESKYGKVAIPQTKRPFLDMVVFTILQQNEHPDNAEAAYMAIKQEFVDWNELRVSHPREIYDLLSKMLKYNAYAKAHHIRETLTQVYHIYNTINLDFLWEKDFREIHRFAQQFHNLEEEFASELSIYFPYAGDIPLHHHAVRVGKRLGIRENKDDSAWTRKTVFPMLDDETFFSLHQLLARHGKSHCLAENYDCTTCTLVKHCQQGQQILATQKASKNKVLARPPVKLQAKTTSCAANKPVKPQVKTASHAANKPVKPQVKTASHAANKPVKPQVKTASHAANKPVKPHPKATSHSAGKLMQPLAQTANHAASKPVKPQHQAAPHAVTKPTKPQVKAADHAASKSVNPHSTGKPLKMLAKMANNAAGKPSRQAVHTVNKTTGKGKIVMPASRHPLPVSGKDRQPVKTPGKQKQSIPANKNLASHSSRQSTKQTGAVSQHSGNKTMPTTNKISPRQAKTKTRQQSPKPVANKKHKNKGH